MISAGRTKHTRISCSDAFRHDPERILSLAIVYGNSDVRYHGYFRPQLKSEWPEAQAVNGIDPEEVKDSPLICDEAEQISFDLPFLEENGITVPLRLACDVMLEYTDKHGEWDEGRQRYKRISLAKCTSDFEVDYRPHDCLEDVGATL
jgi:DNA polymerase III epsilon subunit-like protein